MPRFFLLIAAMFGLALGVAAPSQAAEPWDEIALGDPKAKTVIVEYFSMTCSHCATFEIETLPELRKKWIDTGKVRFVFKDFPLDQLALRGAMLGRCVAAERGSEAYARFVEMLMKSQESWIKAKDPIQALDATALLAGGLTRQKIDACVANKKLEEKMMEGQFEAQKKYAIRSTPSFVVNGKMYAGAMTLEQFDKLLKEP